MKLLMKGDGSPAAKMAEERTLHESKLSKMEAEMKMVFQQKVNEKEAKLKQSEEELYARHREMKEALEKQRLELMEKKSRLESGRPLTPEKVSPSPSHLLSLLTASCCRRRRRDSSEPSFPFSRPPAHPPALPVPTQSSPFSHHQDPSPSSQLLTTQ
jgi:hypothetical protein